MSGDSLWNSVNKALDWLSDSKDTKDESPAVTDARMRVEADLAKKVAGEAIAKVEAEIEQIVILLPASYQEQARGMLKRFGEKCYSMGSEDAIKLMKECE